MNRVTLPGVSTSLSARLSARLTGPGPRGGPPRVELPQAARAACGSPPPRPPAGRLAGAQFGDALAVDECAIAWSWPGHVRPGPRRLMPRRQASGWATLGGVLIPALPDESRITTYAERRVSVR